MCTAIALAYSELPLTAILRLSFNWLLISVVTMGKCVGEQLARF
jgi:hypothetical protein